MTGMKALAQTAVQWAPKIVLADLAAAVLGFWSGLAPPLLIYLFAAATFVVALHIWAALVLPVAFASREQLGFRRYRDLAWYRIAQKGIDDNAYGLALGCFFAALLSGMRPPYFVLVAAGMVLSAAWTAATRRWPRDERDAGGASRGEAD